MSRSSLASIGYKSVRVRIAMPDGAWAFVEEWAKLVGMSLRDAIPVLIGRGIDESSVPGIPSSAVSRSLDPYTCVTGSDGPVYQAQELPGFARPEEWEA